MRRNPLVVGVVATVVLLVVAVAFVLPQGGKVEAAQGALAAADAELSALRSELSELDALASAGTLDADLAAARVQIPSTADLEGLLEVLEAAAARSGVTLVAISPGAPVASGVGDLSSIGLSVSGTGPYFALAQFVYELEHLERLARVISFGVSGGEGQLSLQVSVSVYTTDPNAGPAADPAPGPEVGA